MHADDIPEVPDAHEACDVDENTHELLMKVEFSPEAAKAQPGSVGISTHVHNVDAQAVVSTLILIASKIAADAIAHEMFGSLPDVVAHTMAEGVAREYLHKAVDELPRMGKIEEVVIPDDVSSLIDGE